MHCLLVYEVCKLINVSFVAAFSPGSEVSEDGSAASDLSLPARTLHQQQQERRRRQQQQQQQQGGQYSSQDSLPDSPYSSQSLDSQPLSNAGNGYQKSILRLTLFGID